jgi:hypothetical protein
VVPVFGPADDVEGIADVPDALVAIGMDTMLLLAENIQDAHIAIRDAARRHATLPCIERLARRYLSRPLVRRTVGVGANRLNNRGFACTPFLEDQAAICIRPDGSLYTHVPEHH